MQDVPDLWSFENFIPRSPEFHLSFVAPEKAIRRDAMLIRCHSRCERRLHGTRHGGKTGDERARIAAFSESLEIRHQVEILRSQTGHGNQNDMLAHI